MNIIEKLLNKKHKHAIMIVYLLRIHAYYRKLNEKHKHTIMIVYPLRIHAYYNRKLNKNIYNYYDCISLENSRIL